MSKKNKKNYLDYIPKKSNLIHWQELDNGLVQLIIYRDSILDKVMRKLFFTPDKYVVDLDKIGSFIWKHIDGEKNIYEIAQLTKNEFKYEIEPLYERLIQYMKILKNNKFIDYL
jgi:hypothetical protein